MLGMATGCIGMSLDDFCRCTPSEFRAIWDVWHEMHERRERGAWERARMLALCALQPHARQRLRPADVMTFPWEKDTPAEKRTSSPEPMSREDVIRRYREAIRQRGMS